jgi:hypothetical protein
VLPADPPSPSKTFGLWPAQFPAEFAQALLGHPHLGRVSRSSRSVGLCAPPRPRRRCGRSSRPGRLQITRPKQSLGETFRHPTAQLGSAVVSVYLAFAESDERSSPEGVGQQVRGRSARLIRFQVASRCNERTGDLRELAS